MKKCQLSIIVLFSLFAVNCSLLTANAEVVDRIVAVINDSTITLSDLNTAAELENMKRNGSENQQKIIETRNKILDQLIEKKLVEYASNKTGITVSEKEIDNAIEDVLKQNNISRDDLLIALTKMGLTFKGYREQLKEQIRQVKFVNKEFRSNIKIAHEDIEIYYKQFQDKFSAPVKHRIRIISFPITGGAKSKTAAEEVLVLARKGEDFATLAKMYSRAPNADDGGDLGYVAAGEMDGTIEQTASRLKIGEVSDVISTSTDFHIIQVIDRKEMEPKSISEVEEEIKNIIFQKIMDERYKIWLDEMSKKSYIEVRL